MLHHLHWQRESAIKVLFKKSNKYITNCNEFSLHVNMYALPACMCINISHLVSGFCPGQWHCVQPRDSQLLHITFMTFLCLWLYYILLMWLVETLQQQATVIICIKAQIVLAGVSSKQAGPTPTYHCTGNTGMFKLNKIKCLCRETRSELVWLWLGQCPHHAPRHAT